MLNLNVAEGLTDALLVVIWSVTICVFTAASSGAKKFIWNVVSLFFTLWLYFCGSTYAQVRLEESVILYNVRLPLFFTVTCLSAEVPWTMSKSSGMEMKTMDAVFCVAFVVLLLPPLDDEEDEDVEQFPGVPNADGHVWPELQFKGTADQLPEEHVLYVVFVSHMFVPVPYSLLL